MSVPISLVCWHCGATKNIEAPHKPQFAFELAGWAAEAGMVAYHDMRRARVLLFCNDEHADLEKTAGGKAFRARPKGVANAQQ